MKNSIRLLSMMLLLLITQRCAEDQTPAKPGSVQFALHLSAKDAGAGRRAVSDLYNANTVFITVRKSSGEEVYTRKKLTLLNLGGSLTSEPLLLEAGDYEITEFMLAELGYIVTFATPLEGSDLAEFVQDPLPIDFTINDGAVTDLDVEVIDATLEVPEAFGYATFGVVQAPQPLFQLAIFTPADGAMVLSEAHVYIIDDDDTLFNREVGADVNTFSFVPKNDVYYDLIITANSYKTLARSFSMETLENLNGEPWMITLEPALTMVTPYINGPFPYVFSFDLSLISEATGTIHVNWGIQHNSTRVFTLDEVRSGPLTERLGYGVYPISVTHNVGTIDIIESLGINSPTQDIGLKHLKKLRYFAMALVETPDTIDFSHNLGLLQANLSFTNIRWFDVSNNRDLKDLNLTGATNLSTDALNKIIDDLYQESVRVGSWGGYLGLGVSYDQGSAMIGPPSAASLQKLRTMRDSYGWQIYPQGF